MLTALRSLLVVAGALALGSGTAQANDLEKPYALRIVLDVERHRLLTDVFREQVARELGDGLRAALGKSYPIWIATLLTGIIFSAFHLLGGIGFDVQGLLFLFFILLLNIFLVLTRLLTRSLWLAIGFHTIFDWMAIIVGLGVVVQYDRHLLHLTRTISVSVPCLSHILAPQE